MSLHLSLGCASSRLALIAAALFVAGQPAASQTRRDAPARSAPPTAAAQPAAQVLSLERAIARALNAAPEAEANEARLEALRAAQRQAGVRPNPVLDVTAENVTGTGRYTFLEGVEVTATYAQQLERGGKRQARIALAGREIELAEAEAVVQRLDIARRVHEAYVETLNAEALVGVAAERLRLARGLAGAVQRRVREARDPLFAGTRAHTRVAEAEVDLNLAVHARDAALSRLTALWDGSPEGLTVSIDEFFILDRPDEQFAETVAAADLAVAEARVRRAEAAITVEQTRRVQDPTVRGGARYLNTTGDIALVGGVSIPLARNDTNRANIERAVAERRRAEADFEVARVTRLRELRLARERVEEARLEARELFENVYPGAMRTLEQVQAGFARGGFRHADIDEAGTRLNQVRERMIRATTEFHEARVALDRLTGRFADRLPQEEVR